MVGEDSGSGAPTLADRLRRPAGVVLGDVLAASELLKDQGRTKLRMAMRTRGWTGCEAEQMEEMALDGVVRTALEE
jgi:hypothetical protein